MSSDSTSETKISNAKSSKAIKKVAGEKLRDADKLAHIPIQVVSSTKETMLRKPDWLRIKLPRSSDRIDTIKSSG